MRRVRLYGIFGFDRRNGGVVRHLSNKLLVLPGRSPHGF
jgi:hypothetical protein